MLNWYEVNCELAKNGSFAIEKVKEKYASEQTTFDLIIFEVD